MTHFFNKKSWVEWNQMLAHKHTFDSDHGHMTVEATGGGATLLRCKCGHGEWFFKH